MYANAVMMIVALWDILGDTSYYIFYQHATYAIELLLYTTLFAPLVAQVYDSTISRLASANTIDGENDKENRCQVITDSINQFVGAYELGIKSYNDRF